MQPIMRVVWEHFQQVIFGSPLILKVSEIREGGQFGRNNTAGCD